jgi:hypothetical protein
LSFRAPFGQSNPMVLALDINTKSNRPDGARPALDTTNCQYHVKYPTRDTTCFGSVGSAICTVTVTYA